MPFWSKKPKNQVPPGDNEAEIPGVDVVEIGRKELYEDGFQFCGPPIVAAFEKAGRSITLDHDRDLPDGVEIDEEEIIRWLWVDDECLIEQYAVGVQFRLQDGTTNRLGALDWDLVQALRQRFHDENEPERNWHLGGIDEGYLLVLCRRDELAGLVEDPNYPAYGTRYETTDLTGALEVRRGADL